MIKNTNSIPEIEIQAGKKKDSKNKSKETMKLFADPDIYEIVLHWEPVKKTTEYILEWGMDEDGTDGTFIVSVDETRFVHIELEPATTYYYRITAKLEKKKDRVSKVLAVRTGDEEESKQSDAAY